MHSSCFFLVDLMNKTFFPPICTYRKLRLAVGSFSFPSFLLLFSFLSTSILLRPVVKGYASVKFSVTFDNSPTHKLCLNRIEFGM